MRWLNRLFTALILLAIILVPPAAAVFWAAHNRPWRRLSISGDQAQAWLQNPLTPTTIVAGAAIAAGLLWLAIVVAALRDLARRASTRWRRWRRMPLPTPAQATAGSLAGVALFSVPVLTAPAVDHGPPPATGTGQPHTPTDTPPTATPHHAGQPAGVDLPDGGWIPEHTARTVTAIAGLIWLRRRQTYKPAPTGSRHRDDDLRPLPATADTITAAYPEPDRAPAGHDTGEPLPLDELPAGTITLTGPGATAAARGLLVTALLTTTADDTTGIRVTVTRHDLTTLLGHAPPPTPPIPGLHVTDEPPDAMTAAQTPTAHQATRQNTDRLQILLLRHPAHTTGEAVPDSSTDSTATTVIVGDDPTGTAGWPVAADGTLHTGDNRHRLCVLGQQAAADLITLVTQARGTVTAVPPVTAAPDHLTTAAPERRDLPPHHQSDDQPQQTALVPSTGTATTHLRLRLLGDCRLTHQGQPVVLRRTAGLQILAYLAVHPDGATAKQLIQAVWPGLQPATITNRLWTTISDLRSQLQTLTGNTCITRHDNRYQLTPDTIDIDLWHLQAATRNATHATATTSHQAHHTVVDLHRGELAAGHTWPWLNQPRTALRRDLIDAHLALAETAGTDQTLRHLHDAITIDPYNENLHRRAIHLLHATGDHTAATALADAYQHRLTAAGLHPSADFPTTPPDQRHSDTPAPHER